ncbi:hypothetical protein HETIRDRAFT_455748 [Heterobasidion irregulare TC 32-1]|uniref:Uncharacterized protein n=1 Tax=Heterobasidion irregulare (strain TC 32-1) TaxID=747525 RepID=W4JRQ9_HETIT|nr:uncharacterized protein HETIRDRAFT_455748 [Heterobasidion irregulare TC 32-1]ETW76223.1 hypothetical protein HETIRDRAFT_455748 [Heterobasidion irregulare TC 32-1]
MLIRGPRTGGAHPTRAGPGAHRLCSALVAVAVAAPARGAVAGGLAVARSERVRDASLALVCAASSFARACVLVVGAEYELLGRVRRTIHPRAGLTPARLRARAPHALTTITDDDAFLLLYARALHASPSASHAILCSASWPPSP